MPNNLPDRSFKMKTRKKRRSHHDLNSDEDSTEGKLSEDSDSKFDSVLGDPQAGLVDDLDATCADFTGRPVPGYQEMEGDIFLVRRQKRKGYAYALGHCVSADAAMSAGIAPKFCAHIPDLRNRVQQGDRRRGTLLPVDWPEEQCWVYNLITKEKCHEKPTMEDLRQTLLAMREHAIANGVLEIHLPKIACGKDCMNWSEVRELLLNVFRNTPLRITVHILADDPKTGSQADHLDSTLPDREELDQAEEPYEDEVSSGERVSSTGAAIVGDLCPETNESRVDHAFVETAFKDHAVALDPPEDTEYEICQPTQPFEQENSPARSSLFNPDETEG